MNNICEKLHLFLDQIFENLYLKQLKDSTKVTPAYYCKNRYLPYEKEEENEDIIVLVVAKEEDYLRGYMNGSGKGRRMKQS